MGRPVIRQANAVPVAADKHQVVPGNCHVIKAVGGIVSIPEVRSRRLSENRRQFPYPLCTNVVLQSPPVINEPETERGMPVELDSINAESGGRRQPQRIGIRTEQPGHPVIIEQAPLTPGSHIHKVINVLASFIQHIISITIAVTDPPDGKRHIASLSQRIGGITVSPFHIGWLSLTRSIHNTATSKIMNRFIIGQFSSFQASSTQPVRPARHDSNTGLRHEPSPGRHPAKSFQRR